MVFSNRKKLILLKSLLVDTIYPYTDTLTLFKRPCLNLSIEINYLVWKESIF